MNLDIDFARFTVDDFKYIDARVKISPLTRPIVSDFLFPGNSTTLRGLGPTDMLTHQHECGVNVSLVESRVSLRDQGLCDHALYYPRAPHEHALVGLHEVTETRLACR